MFWLDILRNALYFKGIESETHSQWQLPCTASAIFLPRSDFNGLLLATEAGLATFELSSERFQVFATTGDEAASMRTNDGGVDATGRIWFGTMAKDAGASAGAVYSWSKGEGMRKVLPDVWIPNTFVWSGDGAVLVTADSFQGAINRYGFDATTGEVVFQEQIVKLPSGIDPDGSAMDVLDCFWNAHWNGASVVKYTKVGAIMETIQVPALRPTSCCFGGVDMRTLYITSAAVDLSDDQRRRYPLSGAVFAREVGVRGRTVLRVAGFDDHGGLRE